MDKNIGCRDVSTLPVRSTVHFGRAPSKKQCGPTRTSQRKATGSSARRAGTMWEDMESWEAHDGIERGRRISQVTTSRDTFSVWSDTCNTCNTKCIAHLEQVV